MNHILFTNCKAKEKIYILINKTYEIYYLKKARSRKLM